MEVREGPVREGWSQWRTVVLAFGRTLEMEKSIMRAR